MCQHSPPFSAPHTSSSKVNLHGNYTHSTSKALRRQASGEATGVGALAVVVVNLHVGGSDHRVALHGLGQL